MLGGFLLYGVVGGHHGNNIDGRGEGRDCPSVVSASGRPNFRTHHDNPEVDL